MMPIRATVIIRNVFFIFLFFKFLRFVLLSGDKDSDFLLGCEVFSFF